MVCAPLEGRGQKLQKIKLNRARPALNGKTRAVSAEKEIKMVSRFSTALKVKWKQGWFRTRNNKVEIEADEKKARIRNRTCRERNAKACKGKYTRRREKFILSSIPSSFLPYSKICTKTYLFFSYPDPSVYPHRSFNSFLSFIHFLSCRDISVHEEQWEYQALILDLLVIIFGLILFMAAIKSWVVLLGASPRGVQ